MKLSLLPLLVAIFFSASTQAEFVVIASSMSPINSLTREELGRIYLKRLKILPRAGNLELTPVKQSATQGVEEAFYLHVTQKNTHQLRAYWARLMFTGKGKPPVDGKDDEGVKRLVTKNVGAVGFIHSTALSKEFKVIYRVTD